MLVAIVFKLEAETFDIQNFTTTVTVHENQKEPQLSVCNTSAGRV